MNKKIIIFSIILLICIPVALSFGQYRPLFKQEKIAAPDFSLDKYAQRGLKFLYIDINESTRKVARFARENSFPFLVLVDLDGSVANDYNLIGVPTLFLLDKEGNIISISHQVSDLSIDALFPAKK